MSHQWIVIGISGATCSGKSTLAHNLHELLPQSILISQDEYFHPPDSSLHVKVESLGHLNWEIMSALDMDGMRSDVKNLLSQDPTSTILPSKAKRSDKVASIAESGSYQSSFPFVMILEGFLLLNDPVIFDLCHVRYYLTLTRDQCWERRRVRVYEPPDIPGYFDQVVWPEYEKHRDEVLPKGNIRVYDGMTPTTSITSKVLKEVQGLISGIPSV